MRILFFGSPDFAVPTLELLHDAADVEIVRVFTQPDKPAGRGKKLLAPAVKQAAQAAGLPVEQPEKIRGKAFREYCRSFDADFFVVVAFGKIFPGKLLAVPRFGCVNLHSSLLPELRGAAPVHWAIVGGYSETGVSTMLMDEGMDTGPVLLTKTLAIGEHERTPELGQRLAAAGAPLMLETLRGLSAGTLQPRPQDNEKATEAPLIAKEDGIVDWREPAAAIYNRFRGFYPWPGVQTSFQGSPLKLKDLKPAQYRGSGYAPGTLIPDKGHLFVQCGDGNWLELIEIQLPGKRAQSAADFINGMRLDSPVVLG